MPASFTPEQINSFVIALKIDLSTLAESWSEITTDLENMQSPDAATPWAELNAKFATLAARASSLAGCAAVLAKFAEGQRDHQGPTISSLIN